MTERGALNMCCMLPSDGEDWEVRYRKGLVEPPLGKGPAGAPAINGLLDRPGPVIGWPNGVMETLF